MEKFVLMYSQERKLSIKGVFNTFEEAYNAMKVDFRKYLVEDYGIDEEDIETLDGFLNGDTSGIEAYFYEYGFEKDSAWSNLDDNNNIDWKIEKIEI